MSKFSAEDLENEKAIFQTGKPGSVVIQPTEYSPPFVDPTRGDILKGIFYFDWIELTLLISSWLLTKWIFVPVVGEPMTSQPLLMFWGIIGIIFFTFRHSSSSVFVFMVQRAKITEKMKNGEYVPEFKLTGIVISLCLAFFARPISIVLIWITHTINMI